jgi:hypothetical protein
MIKIKFRHDSCYDAAEWCSSNLKDADWDMWLSDNAFNNYVFEFKSQEAATLFSLRWAEYA